MIASHRIKTAEKIKVCYYTETSKMTVKNARKFKIILVKALLWISLTKDHINIKIITYLCLIGSYNTVLY
jgi:hypothetical protein